MKGFLRNSVLSLLTGILILSVSGVNIYMHHCSCEDLKYVTAIPSSLCCEHGKVPSGGCTDLPSAQSCYSKPDNGCTNSIHFSKTDCCTTEHHFIRLDTEFDRQLKQDQIRLFALLPDHVYLSEHSPGLDSGHPDQYAPSPPVPLSGTELLDLLHQRRIDC